MVAAQVMLRIVILRVVEDADPYGVASFAWSWGGRAMRAPTI